MTMPLLRSDLIDRFVPSNFHDVGGLALRLLGHPHPAGRMAMGYAALGLALSPLDWWMQRREQQRYQQAQAPKKPVIFVCGAARSGTTLVAQTLIKHLPVAYFDNLSSVFSRSPITADVRLGWLKQGGKADLGASSLYGRTARLFEPNDALYLWDRWLRQDRNQVPQGFTPADQEAMRRFFGAYESYRGQSVLQKHNSLSTYAHLVGEILDTAYFVCLDRDPVAHAHSLLRARRFIHGDLHRPYGVGGPETRDHALDPVMSVCRQVWFHQINLTQQVARLGAKRFIVVPYESFCAQPAQWVHTLGQHILSEAPPLAELQRALPPYHASTPDPRQEYLTVRIKHAFAQLNQQFAQIHAL
jgi:hypothetical protein